MAFKYAVALTGGIATGKSSVASLLSLSGFKIIDLDKIAHKALNDNHYKIKRMFGEQFVSGGKVLRPLLGELVFSNPEQKKKLEEFIHPIIFEKAEMESERLDSFGFPYLMEIPLFFETKRYPIDKVIVVYTPRNLQVKRVMKRDSLPEESAIKRIESQMSIEEKRDLGNFTVDNSGDLKQLQDECDRVADEVKRSFIDS